MSEWIFFDIDDTLLDFQAAQKKAVRKFYEIHTEDFSLSFDELYKKWFDIEQACFDAYLEGKYDFDGQRRARFKNVYALSGRTLTDDDAWKCFLEYEDYYRECWCLFDDVLPALKKLKAAGYKLGIISNGVRAQQELKLKKTGIFSYFSVIVTSSDGLAKPGRAIFEHAAALADADMENCVYVGDNYETDIVAAGFAGMQAFYVQRPEHGLNEFADNMAAIK